jgi:hypothetical protein
MPIIHRCEQRSAEWFQRRLSIPTASEFSKILTPTGKLSTQSAAYRHQLLAEWMTGAPLESFSSDWMDRGAELEEQAAKSYCFEMDSEIEKVGFVTTDDGMIGASPDGLIGEDGVIELKCPSPGVHVGYLLTRNLDKEYKVQAQGLLYVTGRKFLDIQSFHPSFPTVIIRMERDEPYIALLDEALREFVAQLLAARADLESRYGPFLPAPKPSEPDGVGALGITDEDIEELIQRKFPEERHG